MAAIGVPARVRRRASAAAAEGCAVARLVRNGGVVGGRSESGLVRPDVSVADAQAMAWDCYGVRGRAWELGSNQDRNFVLETADGARSVLRVDNPVFDDAARDAQHAAIDAYRAAGVPVPAVLRGRDGALTQHWRGLAVRRSAFASGEPMLDVGYLAPVVLAEFGTLAAASVNALATLEHPGLHRAHMWDMRAAAAQVALLAPSIGDAALRQRVVTSAERARAALAPWADALPVQPVHGDLTDDNVTGRRGDDSRLHPHTVLDLGDLSRGWRVAELAVCAASLLHHDRHLPLRVLDTVAAFHASAPLSRAEACAVWPLMVLRAALLVASGWRQAQIDDDNDYARARVAGEEAVFEAATAVPLVEATEHVLARLGFAAGPTPHGSADGTPLSSLLPGLSGAVAVLDAGIESPVLAAGAWLDADAERRLAADALAAGASAAVFPYGMYRLTRTRIDVADAAATWPIDTEVRIGADRDLDVVAPAAGTVAVASADRLSLRLADAEGGWMLRMGGVRPVVAVGTAVGARQVVARVAAARAVATVTVGLVRADAAALADELDRGDGATLVAPDRVPAWSRLTRDPAALLALPSMAQHDDAATQQRRRDAFFAGAQERFYEHPPLMERGWRHHLIDATGRSYIDMVNNVAALGHGHPGVADAVDRQIRILNTNSRFLYRELADYSERLLALMPDGGGLDTVLLVNSGSEAVDLAIRMAQAATGRRTVVALREAYHGWTMASDAVTTSAYDNPRALATRPDWVHVADVPNRFRGTYTGDDTGARYVADLDADLRELAASRRDAAAFLCESVLGNAGGVLLPDGYLAGAYAAVRAHGGLCIADEVQVGFGRMGSCFWGFELSGVVPDIVTIAKPMGNGFPIGAVITSRRVADALGTQGHFFSSAGGNPLSCRVGIAVLDALAAEDLQNNALVVGRHLADGLRALADRHPLVGPVHGTGLFLGVELVTDRTTMEPAAAHAAAICERLRELGVIMLPTSERSNVLKVKPPLCLTVRSADAVVAALDRVLTEGW